MTSHVILKLYTGYTSPRSIKLFFHINFPSSVSFHFFFWPMRLPTVSANQNAPINSAYIVHAFYSNRDEYFSSASLLGVLYVKYSIFLRLIPLSLAFIQVFIMLHEFIKYCSNEFKFTIVKLNHITQK